MGPDAPGPQLPPPTPSPGTRACVRTQVLDLRHNQLAQLPGALATALPRLRQLLCSDNLLTVLPPLPGGLEHLDVGSNRLKRVGWAALAQLRSIRILDAACAFSHRPRGDCDATVGALARLVVARRGELHLSLDADVDELVQQRVRLLARG